MRKHARFGMSSMHRTIACAAWSRLSANLAPRPSTEYAIEGDRAHSYLAVLLGTRGPRTSPFAHVGLTLIDEEIGAFEVTPSIASAIVDALDYIYAIIDRYPDATIRCENYFPFPQGVVAAEDCGTYADIVITSRGTSRAWVIDYKHGIGETVDVEQNAQILGGATCALWWEGFEHITGVILQPRTWQGSGVREVEITGLELVEFVADVEMALRRQLDPSLPATPGDHCKFCPAELVCPARQAAALAVIAPDITPQHIGEILLPVPTEVPMDTVVRVLEGAALLREWLKSYERYAFEIEMSAPGSVPGHKVVEAGARRQFIGDRIEIVRQLLAIAEGELEEDDVSPRQLLGITEIEKKLVDLAKLAAPDGKKKDAAAKVKAQLAFVTTKESSGNLTLVPLSDPRPARNKALQNFGGVVPLSQDEPV